MHGYHLGEVFHRAHSEHVINILSGAKIQKLTNQKFRESKFGISQSKLCMMQTTSREQNEHTK